MYCAQNAKKIQWQKELSKELCVIVENIKNKKIKKKN